MGSQLRCGFREQFGRCEPELLAQDEVRRLRGILYDVVSISPCAWEAGRQCAKGGIVGAVYDLESGTWLPACGSHFDDCGDPQHCFDLRVRAAARG